MDNYVGVFLSLLYMLIMFSAIGGTVRILLRLDTDLWQTLIYGGVIYFLLFCLVYIPIQFTAARLELLTVLWRLISAAVLAIFAALCIRDRRKIREVFPKVDKKKVLALVCFGALAALELVYAMRLTRYTSVMDNSHYNGVINTVVRTGCMEAWDPYTGEKGVLAAFNLIMPYEMHAAVLSSMFGIHPLVIVNRVMGIFEIFCSFFIVALTARRFFEIKAAFAVTVLVFILNIAMSADTIYTGSAFLLYRLGETKSITANIMLPLIIFLVVCLYKDLENKGLWGLLYLTVIAGLLINDSALFLIPVCLFVLLLPLVVYAGKGKVVLCSGLCFAPCLAWIAFYLLS